MLPRQMTDKAVLRVMLEIEDFIQLQPDEYLIRSEGVDREDEIDGPEFMIESHGVVRESIPAFLEELQYNVNTNPITYKELVTIGLQILTGGLFKKEKLLAQAIDIIVKNSTHRGVNLELNDAVAVLIYRECCRLKTMESIEESVKDLVQLLKKSPTYQRYLRVGKVKLSSTRNDD